MDIVAIQLLNAVQYGLLLFLVASGLTLIFGIMGIINLAHGSFYMMGAYMAFTLSSLTGSLAVAMVLGVILSVVLGLFLEWALFSHLYKRDHLEQVLLTYGLILIFEELRSLIVGDRMYLSNEIELREAISKPLVTNALQAFRDEGYLQLRDGKYALTASFADAEAVATIEGRMSGFTNSPR